MRCSDYVSALEGYFDGDLDNRAAAAAIGHAARCPNCSLMLRQLEAERAIYLRYARDVEVTPDLWNGVLARLEEQKVKGGFRAVTNVFDRVAAHICISLSTYRAVVASSLLALGVGAILFFFLNSQRSPLAPEEPAPRVVVNTATDNTATAGTTIDRAAEARVTEPQRTSVKPRPAAVRPAPARRPDPIESRLASTAEAEYVVAIDRLLQDVRRRRERIDPELLARLDLALVSIDYTIEATRKAVKEYPDDPEALQYMLMAYSSKMDVLKEMASL